MGYACKLGANNYSKNFAYCIRAASADNNRDYSYGDLLYDLQIHNKAIYTHTGTYQYTTRLIDIPNQTYTVLPHASEGRYSYGLSFVDPNLIRCYDAYAGMVFMIAFKDNDVEVIAENLTGTSYSATIDCSGYKAAYVNYGGNTANQYSRVNYVDLVSGISYPLIVYSYGSRLNITVSGKNITVSNKYQCNCYYSIIGIK